MCYECAVPGKEELRYETPVQCRDEEKRRIAGLDVRLARGPGLEREESLDWGVGGGSWGPGL